MQIHFIINPKNDDFFPNNNLSDLFKLLWENNHSISLDFTKPVEDTVIYVKNAENINANLIVICGGDGTVNEVINSMIKFDVNIPFLIIPMGTVNDFAKYMNCTLDAKKIYEKISEFKKINVDVGKCGDKYFLNVAALGLFSDVSYKTNNHLKKNLGRAAYVITAIKNIKLDSLKPIEIAITSQEYSKKQKVMLLIVSNTKSVGGYTKMAPEASVNDGKLDVIVFPEMPLPDILDVFLKLKNGNHIDNQNVIYFQTKKIELEGENVELDIDGEFYGNLPVAIEVIPNKMEMII